MSEIDALRDRLRHENVLHREKAAAEIAGRSAPPPAELLPVLIEAVERIHREDVRKGPRFEAECPMFEALLRYSGDPRLETELPRIARHLIEVAGDPWPDDSDTPIRARAADLLALFAVPAELVPALAKVLESDHRGFYVGRRVVEALARAGGDVALRAIVEEAERELARLSGSRCSPLYTPGELELAVVRAREATL